MSWARSDEQIKSWDCTNKLFQEILTQVVNLSPSSQFEARVLIPSKSTFHASWAPTHKREQNPRSPKPVKGVKTKKSQTSKKSIRISLFIMVSNLATICDILVILEKIFLVFFRFFWPGIWPCSLAPLGWALRGAARAWLTVHEKITFQKVFRTHAQNAHLGVIWVD